MIFAPVKIEFSDNSLKTSKTIKKLISRGYSYGLVHQCSNGNEYVCATKGVEDIITHEVLKHLEGLTKAVYITEFDEGLYFLFFQNKRVIAELVIASKEDEEPLKLIKANIFGLEGGGQITPVCTDLVASEYESKFTLSTQVLGDLSFDTATYTLRKDNTAEPQKTIDLKSYLSQTKRKVFQLAMVGVFALSFAGYFAWVQTNTPTQVTIADEVATSSPNSALIYSDLSQRLTKKGMNAVYVLKEVSKQLSRLQMLPGWDAFALQVTNSDDSYVQLRISLKAAYGTIAELSKYAKQYDYQINVENETGFLISTIEHLPIVKSSARFHAGSYQLLITNSINAWWDNAYITFGNNQNKPDLPWVLKKTDIKIDNLYPQDINSLSSLLIAMPLEFQSLTCKRDLAQTLRWEIELSMNLIGVI